MQSGNDTILWDATIQRDVEALAGFKEYEIEAHIIAIKNHFKEQIDYSEILNIIRTSCKQQAEQRNKNTFTMSVYNRIKLRVETTATKGV